MWLLMRGNSFRADPDGGITLASSPDTPARPVPWRWTVRAEAGEVAVLVDPAVVGYRRSEHAGERLQLTRDGGEALVIVALAGGYQLSHPGGPWRRRLDPGDVAVLEGEAAEPVALDPAGDAARVCLVRLHSLTGAPLRWDP